MKRFFVILMVTTSCSSFHGSDLPPDGGMTDAGPVDGGGSVDSASGSVTNDAGPDMCDGGPSYTHTAGGDVYGSDAGVAEWTDCVPLRTFSQDQAMKACEAWVRLYPSGGQCRIDENLTAPGCNTDHVQTMAGPFGWLWAGGKFQMDANGCHPDGDWD